MKTVESNTKLIPVEFNTKKHTLMRTIIDCFSNHGYKCKKTTARKIVKNLNHFPESDEVLWSCLQTFYAPVLKDCADDVVDKELKRLAAMWKNAQDATMQTLVEQQMLIATDGLEEHPEWFDYPCICNTCKSYA